MRENPGKPMSNTFSSENLGMDFNDVFQQASTYIEGLIARETIPFQLATRLNGEVPAKMEDSRRSLVAMLEERLAERGEKSVSGLKPQMRIRYHDDRMESKLAAEYRIPTWTTWKPSFSECARKTGGILVAAFGLAAVLAALKAAGISSIKFPVYADSPSSTAAIFAGLAVLSGVAATHPEKVPTLVEQERRQACEHVAAYLRDARAAFLDSTRKAEAALDTYIEQLQGTNSTTA
jgi:hypothetical protein